MRSVFSRHRLVLLAALPALAVACSPPPAPAPTAPPVAQDPVARGKYLVTVMDCNGCHTPFKNGAPDMTLALSGHPESIKISAPKAMAGWPVMINETNTAWRGPWGVSFTANLTSDQNTGLGIWTEDMFIRSIREGKHMGTSREVLPPMPWRMQANLTDEDIKAIFAYLKTVPPVANHVPEPISPPPSGRGQ